MTSHDPIELYLATINAQPIPDPEQQFAWTRALDRAQQQYNRAIAEDVVVSACLLDKYRCNRSHTASGYFVARVVQEIVAPDQLQISTDQLLADCMQRLEGLLTGSPISDPQADARALQPLRLRTECMLELNRALTASALEPQSNFLFKAKKLVAEISELTDYLVRANQRLVAMLARQYQHGPLPFMDLVQEGNLGLLRAIERFDPEQGTRLSTYAMWWIRRAMVYAVARQGRDVRPSVAQYWEARQVARTLDRMEPEQGRRATHAEVAQRMGTSVEAIHRALNTLQPSLALDAPIAATSGLSRMETMAAVTPSPEANADADDLRHAVAALLAHLPERQARVLQMRFGIGIRDDCTLEQIAQQQGVTRERIRQIEAQALATLRAMNASWELQGCMS